MSRKELEDAGRDYVRDHFTELLEANNSKGKGAKRSGQAALEMIQGACVDMAEHESDADFIFTGAISEWYKLNKGASK